MSVSCITHGVGLQLAVVSLLATTPGRLYVQVSIARQQHGLWITRIC